MKERAHIPFGLIILASVFLPQIVAATIRDIDVINFAFTPPNTVANVGDTIRWSFVTGTHSTTSDAGSPKSWNSDLRSNGTFSIVINPSDGPGPFPYHCTLHATMKDTIRVSPSHDGDGDGVPDVSDNCPFAANPTQTDADNDSYGAACDCNDTQIGIHPGASEVLDDGIDQDCNGSDAVTCFVDADMDGHGSLVTVVATDGTCDVAQGESATASDCNDGNPAIHPGAAEIPDDGIDQDCSGTDAVTCFVDADMDSYGTTAGTTVIAADGSCNAAAGESGVNTDCNDLNPAIHPGAVEIPGDGIDQDCNGSDQILSCCVLRVGDANGLGTYPQEVTIGDIQTLITAKFIAGTCAGVVACLAEGDINQSGGANPTCNDITIGDVQALVNHLFIAGPINAPLNSCL